MYRQTVSSGNRVFKIINFESIKLLYLILKLISHRNILIEYNSYFSEQKNMNLLLN